jgi:hypothetical protein
MVVDGDTDCHQVDVVSKGKTGSNRLCRKQLPQLCVVQVFSSILILSGVLKALSGNTVESCLVY